MYICSNIPGIDRYCHDTHTQRDGHIQREKGRCEEVARPTRRGKKSAVRGETSLKRKLKGTANKKKRKEKGREVGGRG